MIHVVKCTSRECTEYLKQKTIRLQHLGQGVYGSSTLICGVCGCTLWTERLSRISPEEAVVVQEIFDEKIRQWAAIKECRNHDAAVAAAYNSDQLMMQFTNPIAKEFPGRFTS